MTKYEDFIYLRGKTKANDIAECISKTFSSFGIDFPNFKANTSRYCFKFEIEYGSVYLQQEKQSFDFKFKGFINESEECISIKYNEAENKLEYSETFSAPLFLTAFFNNCRSYSGKCLFPDVIEVNRDISERYCSEINSAGIKADELRITFYADENGKLLFPQEWMGKLSKDLYFLNINHRYDKGLSVLDIDFENEQLLKELCSCFKMEKLSVENLGEPFMMEMQKQCQNPQCGHQRKEHICKPKGNVWNHLSTKGKEEFKSFVKDSCDNRKRLLKEKLIMSPNAKIIIETQKDKTEITKEAFKCASYEEFCAFMLNEVLKIRKTKFSSSDAEIDTFIPCESNNKYKLENQKLKNDLQKARADIEALKKQKAELLEELKELKCQIPADKNASQPGSAENSAVINELKAENHELREKNKRIELALNDINTKDETSSSGFITLSIPCAETNLFKNEIEDYCYGVLYSALEYEQQNLPQNKADEKSRKVDVITDILARRKFRWENTWTFRQIADIETVLRSSRRPSFQELAKYGFISKQDCKKHPKCYFYEERYQLTFSLTPSDANFPNLKMKEIKARCFLVPVRQGCDSGSKNAEATKISA